MTDEPLPGMPAPPPVLEKSPKDVRIARSDNRHLCEECCRQIHVQGIIRAPYPSTARWRITTAESAAFLCHNHKEEWVSQNA